MKTIDQIIKDLKGMKITDDIENDISCVFEDYSYKGETEVIVSKDESNFNISYQAYINQEDSPIVCIKVNGDKIADAWIA